MTISPPLTSRAKKQKVVIQCVTRTRAECREVAVVAETAEAETGTQAESPTGESYHVPRAERLSPLRRLSLLNEGGMLLAEHFTQDKCEAFLRLVRITPAHAVRYTSLEEAAQIIHQLRIDN
jgi:hypothetical protein